MPITTRSGRKLVVVEEEEEDQGELESSNKGKGKRKEIREASEVVEEPSDYHPESTKRKSKQSKNKASSKKRKHGGALSELPNLPLDVLAEICSHLDPLDLIHLSRVSKSFFKLVDGSSFKSVWIGVRKRIKLEDLEAGGLSELQHAAMVLDHHCQMCGKGNIKQVDYWVRRRYCPACKKKSLIPVYERVRKLKAHPFLYECALSSLRGGTGANASRTVYYHFPSLPEINSTLALIQSRIEATCTEGYESVHSKNHMAVERRYKALRDAGKEDEEFVEDESELREYVGNMRRQKEMVNRDAERLEGWSFSKTYGWR
ncbi:hypothetical protein JCM5353_006562 [Sporobolomyces roseus]